MSEVRIAPLFRFRGTPEFETDGCSGYLTAAWNLIFGCDPPFEGACERHDREYWDGVNWRLAADCRLTWRVMSCGRTWPETCLLTPLALAMFAAVRMFGTRWTPFSWRWLYRLPWWRAVLVSWWRD